MFRKVPTVYMWDDHDYGPNNADGTFIGKEVARCVGRRVLACTASCGCFVSAFGLFPVGSCRGPLLCFSHARTYRPFVVGWDGFGGCTSLGSVHSVAYQQYFPHYPLAAGSGNVPIQQAFTVGRVRYIVTDLRSESSMPGALNTTMGYAQRDWFIEELSKFADYGMVVWVNTKPWMGAATTGTDRWPGFSAEREYISDKIVEMGVNNLVSLSGDAHLVAIDSGAHMDYSSSGGAGCVEVSLWCRCVGRVPEVVVLAAVGGLHTCVTVVFVGWCCCFVRHCRFPVFHSAPMAQMGSSKNVGPFTEGCASYRFYVNHQYGTMQVTDDGSKICLDWKAYRYSEDDPLMEYQACTPTVVKGVVRSRVFSCVCRLLVCLLSCEAKSTSHAVS